jgi:hypothetical protein
MLHACCNKYSASTFFGNICCFLLLVCRSKSLGTLLHKKITAAQLLPELVHSLDHYYSCIFLQISLPQTATETCAYFVLEAANPLIQR